MATRPRKGLNALSHGVAMPLVAVPDPKPAEAPEPEAAPPTPEPVTKPAPAVSATRKGRARATVEDPSGRVRVRQRDDAKLIRKGWRLKEHVVEALAAYCEAERWPESTVVERAIEHYLDSLDGAAAD